MSWKSTRISSAPNYTFLRYYRPDQCYAKHALLPTSKNLCGVCSLCHVESQLPCVSECPNWTGTSNSVDGKPIWYRRYYYWLPRGSTCRRLAYSERRKGEKIGCTPRIKCALFIVGWQAIHPVLEAEMIADQTEERIEIPTCHVISSNDHYIHRSMCRYNLCDEGHSELLDQGAGHILPHEKQVPRSFLGWLGTEVPVPATDWGPACQGDINIAFWGATPSHADVVSMHVRRLRQNDPSCCFSIDSSTAWYADPSVKIQASVRSTSVPLSLFISYRIGNRATLKEAFPPTTWVQTIQDDHQQKEYPARCAQAARSRNRSTYRGLT